MSVDPAVKAKFRDETFEIFSAIERQFGIKPIIGLMQAAHESNWGVSQLATDGKNLFGMMAGSAWCEFMSGIRKETDVPNWSSLGRAVIYLPTREYSKHPPEKIRYWDFKGDIIEKKPDGKGGSIVQVKRAFRKYADWKESAWDWARKIAQTPKYAKSLAAAVAGNATEYAKQIRLDGYATDPSYTEGMLATAVVIGKLPPRAA